MSDQDYDGLMTMFMSRYLEEICTGDGEVKPFELVEPHLQDFCSDEGINFLNLREWLKVRGWIEECD